MSLTKLDRLDPVDLIINLLIAFGLAVLLTQVPFAFDSIIIICLLQVIVLNQITIEVKKDNKE